MEAALQGPTGRIVLGPTVLTIGRISDNQLVVNDAKASSRHAEIRPNEQGYTITDLASTNGTFVNEQRLDHNVPRLLNHNDRIRIGDTIFNYAISTPSQVAPTYVAPSQPGSPTFAPTVAAEFTGYDGGAQQAYPPYSPPYGVPPNPGEMNPYGLPDPYGANISQPQPSLPPPPPSHRQVSPYDYIVESSSSGVSQPKPATDYGSPPYGVPPNPREMNPYGLPNPHGVDISQPQPSLPSPPPPRRQVKIGLVIGILTLVLILVSGIGVYALFAQRAVLPKQSQRVTPNAQTVTLNTQTATPTAVFSSGTWQGQGTYYKGQSAFDMLLKVTINGNTFSGTLTENVYNTTVNITGTINGDTISFTDTSYVSGNHIQLNNTYTATVSNGRMSGFWYFPGHSSPDGTLTLTLTTQTATPGAQTVTSNGSGLDTSFYYRLTNTFLGPGQSLDVRSDGSYLLKMAPTGNYTGQFWKLVPLGGGKYALRTAYLGDGFSLDVINDGVDNTPKMSATGNYSGQSWSLVPWGDGTYKLTNDFTGPDKALDTYSDTHDPFLGPGDHTGQHWTLTQLTKIQA